MRIATVTLFMWALLVGLSGCVSHPPTGTLRQPEDDADGTVEFLDYSDDGDYVADQEPGDSAGTCAGGGEKPTKVGSRQVQAKGVTMSLDTYKTSAGTEFSILTGKPTDKVLIGSKPGPFDTMQKLLDDDGGSFLDGGGDPDRSYNCFYYALGKADDLIPNSWLNGEPKDTNPVQALVDSYFTEVTKTADKDKIKTIGDLDAVKDGDVLLFTKTSGTGVVYIHGMVIEKADGKWKVKSKLGELNLVKTSIGTMLKVYGDKCDGAIVYRRKKGC